MNTDYVDYFSQFENELKLADLAYDVASESSISHHLHETCNLFTDEITKRRIIGENDVVIREYNEVVDEIVSRINQIDLFAKSYTEAEAAYGELRLALLRLESEDQFFKKKYQYKPDRNDQKYKSFVGESEVFNSHLYNTDLKAWERTIISVKKGCEMLANNVKEYLDYLRAVNEFDPKNGTIPSTIVKPTRLTLSDIYGDASESNEEAAMSLQAYTLEGDELVKFLNDNNIPNEEYIVVVKKVVHINGVPINTYSVYDNNCTAEENQDFERYIEYSLEYEELIDPAILSKVFSDNGYSTPAIVFEQSYRCDGGSIEKGKFWCAAYCNSCNRNVVMFYHPSWDQYYSRSIIHETGHAYDFTLGYELTGQIRTGLSGIANEYTGQIYDSDGKPLTWMDIIRNEVNYFDDTQTCYKGDFTSKEEAQKYYDNYCLNATDYEIYEDEDGYTLKVTYNNPNGAGVSLCGGNGMVYNVHDYVASPTEYFADSFHAYWMGDYGNADEGGMSRLEFLCPETYEAMDSLIRNEIVKNNGGKQ